MECGGKSMLWGQVSRLGNVREQDRVYATQNLSAGITALR